MSDADSRALPHPESDAADAEETLAKFEELVSHLVQPRYSFRLYVAGNTPRSTAAVAHVRRICEMYLEGRFELEVFDVYQRPEAAASDQVIAIPTLIKELPLPQKTFVGDMSNEERIVVGLNLARG